MTGPWSDGVYNGTSRRQTLISKWERYEETKDQQCEKRMANNKDLKSVEDRGVLLSKVLRRMQ